MTERSGDDPQLLQPTELVDNRPMLDDLAVGDLSMVIPLTASLIPVGGIPIRGAEWVASQVQSTAALSFSTTMTLRVVAESGKAIPSFS